MTETFTALPWPFWLVAGLLALGAAWAYKRIPSGLGGPVLAVLGTVAFWYPGDAWYNDYARNHKQLFSAEVLQSAWLETAWFLVVFLALVDPVHRAVNGRYLSHRSQVGRLYRVGVELRGFQSKLEQLFQACVGVWAVLAIVAVARLRGESLYYFFPFLAYRADPWGRGQIGGGISALLSLAGYLQTFAAACFGIVAALTQNPRVRTWALVGCGMTWPYFIFDRTRHVMVAVVLPALLSWAFLRLRASLLMRVAILAVCFLAVDAWFRFVLDNRSETTVASAFRSKGFKAVATQEARHEGLNMYEELCWINCFLEDGSYRPNWGERYFTELVNPIPRGLWPSKPLIGLDYAVARGQQFTEEGTTATISTGMIGQGVVNFGRWLGPAAAALLMSLWVAVLVRCDLRGQEVGRLPLYVLGLVLTFNLGRDITLITLYSFVFGWAVVWGLERWGGEGGNQPARGRPGSAGMPKVQRAPTPEGISLPQPPRAGGKARWHMDQRGHSAKAASRAASTTVSPG